jgi:hypothetical protein
MQMEQFSQQAIAFVRRLSALAERLAERDIVVHTLNCQWGSFGAWELAVRDGREWDEAEAAYRSGVHFESLPLTHYRATWDGRDRDLVIESHPATPLSMSGSSKVELARRLDTAEEAISVAEGFFQERFARDA